MNQRRRAGDILPVLMALAFLALFFYYPMVTILKHAFITDTGQITARHIIDAVASKYNQQILIFTIKQALLSTVITLCLGLPGAYLLTKYQFPGKSVIKALSTVPFVMPSIIVILGFIIFFGNNGIINVALMRLFNLTEPPIRFLYSMTGIMLAHAFFNFPIVIRIVGAAWERIDPGYEEMAAGLGASNIATFRRVTLPLLLPGIIASAALTFVFCFSSFAIVLVLGGARYATIEVGIYTLTQIMLKFDKASSLAIIQALFSLTFMYLYIKTLDIYHAAGAERMTRPIEPKRLAWRNMHWVEASLLVAYLILILIVIFGPMLSVVYSSFQYMSGNKILFGLRNYLQIFSTDYDPILGANPLRSILNSLGFAIATVLIALPLALILAYITVQKRFKGKRLLDAVFMLPLGVSAVTLALGYARAFNSPPLEFTGTALAIILAHSILAYPLAMRAIAAVWLKLDLRQVETAQSLGASRIQAFWRVELPLLRPGIIVGAVFAFAISIGEVTTTYMLYRPEIATMPISIFRFISSYNFYTASAMGVILMAVCALAFFAIEKLKIKTWW